MIADPVTAAAFKAASTLTAKAEAVRDALGDGTLTVTVRDGATTHFTGTIAGPMTASGGTLSHSGVLAGAVAVSGTPNAATWRCRIANGEGRYVEDAIGPGARFTWSQAGMVAGQGATGVKGAVFAEPAGDDLVGAKIGEFADAAFESSLDSDAAHIKVPVDEFGGESLDVSDDVVVYLQSATHHSRIVPGTVIEE